MSIADLSGISTLLHQLLSDNQSANTADNLMLDHEELAVEFWETLAAFLASHPPPTITQDAVTLMRDFFDQRFSGSPRESFCQGKPAKTAAFSRIVSLLDLQRFEVGPFRGRGFDEPALDRAREQLKSDPESFEITGRLRGSCQHFFWLTETDALASLVELDTSGRPIGLILRDVLGFAWHFGDVDYVELRFEKEFFEVGEVVRPTIAEGGTYSVYCSWPQTDEYSTGFTWDLYRSCPGLPEFVCPAKNAQRSLVTARYLARIYLTAPPFIDWHLLSGRASKYLLPLKRTLGILS